MEIADWQGFCSRKREAAKRGTARRAYQLLDHRSVRPTRRRYSRSVGSLRRCRESPSAKRPGHETNFAQVVADLPPRAGPER